MSGLLGHYTSRYSDYDGYWLFGLLMADLDKLKIDLLPSKDPIDGAEPLRTAVRLARHTFRDQMTKAGLPMSLVREACIEITRSETPAKGWVNGLVKPGHMVTFVAKAVSDLGTAYEIARSAFIAPHDPAVEQRSLRR